jgi:hypothetical protein
MLVSVGDLYLRPGYAQPENIATCISTAPAKCVNHTRDYYPNVIPPPVPPDPSFFTTTRANGNINSGSGSVITATPTATARGLSSISLLSHYGQHQQQSLATLSHLHSLINPNGAHENGNGNGNGVTNVVPR